MRRKTKGKDEVREIVRDVFNKIKKAESIGDLIKIEDDLKDFKKLNSQDYPQIAFSLTNEEIEGLKSRGILGLDDDGYLSFKNNISEKIVDPLTKLLYVLAWKNGDLKKIKHIVKGVLEADKGNDDQKEALVFYQFGKYLTKNGQPIIDQHVIRAFSVYKAEEEKEQEEWRGFDGQMGSKDKIKIYKDQISKYIDWLVSGELKEELRLEKDYTYYIDRILFATGKAIKKKS